jgi:hypothetical protein
MASGPEYPSVLESMAISLRENIGPFYDQVFLATRVVFPTLTIIERTSIQMSPSSDLLVGGISSDGIPMVHIGTKIPLTQTVRERLVRRLELPTSPSPSGDPIFMRIVFAHELGHVLQADPLFEDIFGPIDQQTYIPEDDYLAYLCSDKEMNADYIAACLMSSTELGKSLEIPTPDQTPIDWREWASRHR